MTSTINILLGTARSGSTAMAQIISGNRYELGKPGGPCFHEPTNLTMARDPRYGNPVRLKLLEEHDKYLSKYSDDFDFTDYLINLSIQNNFKIAKLHPLWGDNNLFIANSVTRVTLDSTPYLAAEIASAPNYGHNNWAWRIARDKIEFERLHRDGQTSLRWMDFTKRSIYDKFGDAIYSDKLWVTNAIAQIKELIEHKKVEKILLLYRKDLFKQALSFCISCKLNVWHDPDCDFVRKSAIGELNEGLFKGMLWKLDCYNKFIKSLPNNDKYKLCMYENFYERKGQEAYWEDMFKFLNYEYGGPEDRMSLLGSPLPVMSRSQNVFSKTDKYNGPETYAKIKNLDNLKNIYSDFMSLFS